MTSRTTLTALIVAIVAVLLPIGQAQAAPYVVRDHVATQAAVIGDTVSVGATLCPGDMACADGVAPAWSTAVPPWAARGLGLQLFAAFLVPAGATPADTASAQLPPAGAAPVTLARATSLDATLELTRPAPPGRRWVGYLAPEVGAAGVLTTAADDWTATAAFTIGRGVDGLPAPPTFTHAALAGARLASTDTLSGYAADPSHTDTDLALAASRPVDCGETRRLSRNGHGGRWRHGHGHGHGYGHWHGRGATTVPTTLCGATSDDADLVLADLRGTGGAVFAKPGTTVTVPFTWQSTGKAAPAYALTATTGVPGGTATPQVATFTPDGPGTHAVAVDVAVPEGTQPGDYAVTLTATLDEETRVAQGTVTVPSPSLTAPDGIDPADGTLENGLLRPVLASSQVVRAVEFRGLDRTGPAADGKSITLGDVVCNKGAGVCDLVTVQLSVPYDQLHPGTGRAPQPSRRVTIAQVRLSVPARSKRRARVVVGPAVRRLLAAGQALDAVVAVRPASNRTPIVQPITLRRS